GAIRFWSQNGAEAKPSLQIASNTGGYMQTVYAALSPDGAQVATVVDSAISVWNSRDGKKQWEYTEPHLWPSKGCFSHRGPFVGCCGRYHERRESGHKVITAGARSGSILNSQFAAVARHAAGDRRESVDGGGKLVIVSSDEPKEEIFCDIGGISFTHDDSELCFAG